MPVYTKTGNTSNSNTDNRTVSSRRTIINILFTLDNYLSTDWLIIGDGFRLKNAPMRIPIDLRINSKFSRKMTRERRSLLSDSGLSDTKELIQRGLCRYLQLIPPHFSPSPLHPSLFITIYIYIYSSILDERAQRIVSQRTKQYEKRRERIPRRYWMRDARDLIRVANGRDICALIVFWPDDLAPFAC